MKEIFEAIAWLFEGFVCSTSISIGFRIEKLWRQWSKFLLPFGWFRCYVYWINQLKQFNDCGEENKDPSAHFSYRSKPKSFR